MIHNQISKRGKFQYLNLNNWTALQSIEPTAKVTSPASGYSIISDHP